MKAFFILINVACLCHTTSAQSDVRLPPTLTRWPQGKETWYTIGDKLTLKCGAEGTPAVRYDWKMNGLHLNTTLSNISCGSDGTLTISRTTEMDEGYYQCLASNPYGTALSNTTSVRMKFNQPNAGTSIAFRRTIGTPFHIRVHRHRSYPQPYYSWLWSNDLNDLTLTALQPSQRIQIAENEDLHFAYLLQEDARYYTCTSTYGYLSLHTRARLVVIRSSTGDISQSAPTLAFSSVAFDGSADIISVPQITALAGSVIKLRCFFYGFPQPNISWTSSTNILPNDRFILRKFNSTLIGARLTETDGGNYSCTGSNIEGNYTHTFQIRVEAKPTFDSKMYGPYDVNVTEGESVNFNCNATADPEANIAWLQNGQPIDTGNPPERFEFSSNKKSLMIRDVCRDCVDRESKTDLMVIQCNASNDHGYAFAQGYLNVLTKTKVTITGEKAVTVDFREQKHFTFQCVAASDPSTPATVRWYKTEPFNDLVRNDPPHVIVETEFLIVMVSTNCSSECAKHLGEYRCVGGNGYSWENKTIRISYQYRPPSERFPAADVTKNNDSLETWKIILIIAVLGIVLLLTGGFLHFRRKRRFGHLNRHINKERRLPEAVYMRDDGGYDTIGQYSDEAAGSNEKSMRRDSGEYDHIGYDSIDQVLEEMGKREDAMTNPTDVQGQNIYYDSKAQREAIGMGRPTLGKNITCDEVGYLTPSEVIVIKGGKDEQQMNYYESVHESESDQLQMSNDQAKSSYCNREEEVSPEVALGTSDLIRKEANCQLGLLPKELNQYEDLGRKEENQYTDLSTAESEDNQYMVPAATEVIQDQYMVPKDLNQYANLDIKELTQNVDHGQKEVNQCTDMKQNEVNQ